MHSRINSFTCTYYPCMEFKGWALDLRGVIHARHSSAGLQTCIALPMLGTPRAGPQTCIALSRHSRAGPQTCVALSMLGILGLGLRTALSYSIKAFQGWVLDLRCVPFKTFHCPIHLICAFQGIPGSNLQFPLKAFLGPIL